MYACVKLNLKKQSTRAHEIILEVKKTFKIFSFVKLACPIGFYGQDCSEKCNDTCAGCNHASGVCDSGCVSGWMGHFCNQSIVFTSN